MANTKASSSYSYINSINPTGVVSKFSGSTIPTGWLACDGSQVLQSAYPALYSVLGSTYATQYNPVTGSNWAAPDPGYFRVPDYRGIFLKGVGTPNGLEAVTLGSFQNHKTAKNGLSLTDPGHYHSATSGLNFVIESVGYSIHTGDRNQMAPNASTNSRTSGISLTGDTETRPINKGVNYIIRT